MRQKRGGQQRRFAVWEAEGLREGGALADGGEGEAGSTPPRCGHTEELIPTKGLQPQAWTGGRARRWASAVRFIRPVEGRERAAEGGRKGGQTGRQAGGEEGGK